VLAAHEFCGNEMNNRALERGDIVRLSELGRKKVKKPERQGRVLSVSPTGSQIKVQWDGLKTPYMVHASFLERDEQSD
jgi:hypothetical protein